ncbi:MAG TPA: NUDIX domain-containing protein [Marmoricola sp.]|nr:NUDIX domain-containing protein [Marmoricola sp.]
MPSPRWSLVPASYVYLVRDQQVLLQLRRNTGYLDDHWVAGAAGHVEAGETARGCAVRELREELGVRVHPSALTPLTVMQRTDGTTDPLEQRVDWFFTADGWTGTPRAMEPQKCAEIRWFPLARLPDPMPEYEHRVLTGLRSGELPMFTAHGFEEH